MDELAASLALGLSVAFTPTNVLYAFIGCALGTFVGVLPGIGSSATIAILLPLTYTLAPETALIMMAGIYYGAQYGGSTTAIMLKLPGESSSVVTCKDGYAMARNGRAGPALVAAGVSSFVAGCFGVVVLILLVKPLTSMVFAFGAAEYFSLMVVGLVGAVTLSSSTSLEAIGMLLIGLLLGLVGTDANTGVVRYTLGVPDLVDGLSFTVIAMGVFGCGEVIAHLLTTRKSAPATYQIGKLWPTKTDFKNMCPAVLRGSVIGSLLGALPGGGSTISSFAAYAAEKRVQVRNGERPLGEGNIRGVASPEAANNASTQTAFIPLLGLGIPATASTALMLGAMMMHNIQPGPRVVTDHPDMFWGLIVSMFIGNAMLLVLNVPLIGLWVRLLSIPYKIMAVAIIVFCAVGAYSVSNNPFHVGLLGLFGAFGYLLIKLRLDPTPLLLGFILGPMLEESLRRALLLAKGDWGVFLSGGLSTWLLGLAGVLLLCSIIKGDKDDRYA